MGIGSGCHALRTEECSKRGPSGLERLSGRFEPGLSNPSDRVGRSAPEFLPDQYGTPFGDDVALPSSVADLRRSATRTSAPKHANTNRCRAMMLQLPCFLSETGQLLEVSPQYCSTGSGLRSHCSPAGGVDSAPEPFRRRKIHHGV